MVVPSGKSTLLKRPTCAPVLAFQTYSVTTSPGCERRSAPADQLSRHRTAHFHRPVLDVALFVLVVRLDERVGIDPEEFRHHGVLQHDRRAHVERRGAVMRERRAVNRGESGEQDHHHQDFRFHRAPPGINLAGDREAASLPHRDRRIGSAISFKYRCTDDGTQLKSKNVWLGIHRKFTVPETDRSGVELRVVHRHRQRQIVLALPLKAFRHERIDAMGIAALGGPGLRGPARLSRPRRCSRPPSDRPSSRCRSDRGRPCPWRNW